PGMRYKYSNNAFNILADVIAKASTMSFESYMKNFILAPTGMKNSTFMKPEVPDELATSPHISLFGIKKVSKIYPYNRVHAGSGTLNSNVEDMIRYAITYLNRGTYEETEIFNDSTYKLITTKQRTLDERRDIGLSWFISSSSWRQPKDRGRIGHSGGDRGYGCYLGILPEKSWAIITLYNCDWRKIGSDAIFDAGYELASKYK
ncbi:MAG: serine hydrolase domain-containing protein, partial [Cyclobacteriaceae bacterium]